MTDSIPGQCLPVKSQTAAFVFLGLLLTPRVLFQALSMSCIINPFTPGIKALDV
jgi:hypothetical protein